MGQWLYLALHAVQGLVLGHKLIQEDLEGVHPHRDGGLPPAGPCSGCSSRHPSGERQRGEHMRDGKANIQFFIASMYALLLMLDGRT